MTMTIPVPAHMQADQVGTSQRTWNYHCRLLKSSRSNSVITAIIITDIHPSKRHPLSLSLFHWKLLLQGPSGASITPYGSKTSIQPSKFKISDAPSSDSGTESYQIYAAINTNNSCGAVSGGGGEWRNRRSLISENFFFSPPISFCLSLSFTYTHTCYIYIYICAQAGLAVIGNSTVELENSTDLRDNSVAVGFGDDFFQINGPVSVANSTSGNSCAELWDQVYSKQCM